MEVNLVVYIRIFIQLQILRIARSTLFFTDFLTKTRELIHRLTNQGAIQHTTIRHLWKIIQHHPNGFSHFKMETEEMLSQIFDWYLFLSLNNIKFSTLFCFLLGWVPPSGRVLNWCNTLQWSIASSCQKCLRVSCK